MRGIADGNQGERGKTGIDPSDAAAPPPVGHLLRRAYHAARENSTQLLAQFDLTPRQANALSEIRRRGSISQAEIGEAIGMEPANVTGLIARLKKKHLIAAERDPLNSRRMQVHLTESGAKIAGELVRITRRTETMTLRALSEEESAQLIRLLQKLLAKPNR
ncbi:MAG: MarR family winged helix-turn-helix transcriptional regulator [Burkholderiales bacterium]